MTLAAATHDPSTLGPGPTENPYWDAVRALPGDDITLRYERRWQPRLHAPPPGWPFGRLGGDPNDHGPSREELVRRYAWAICDPASLAFVANHAQGRVVEIGAGRGYWAWQLAQLGVDVVAYDLHPPDRGGNYYHSPRTAPDGRPSMEPVIVYHPVRRGGAPRAAQHPDRTLLLCWPPYGGSIGWRALRAYTGHRVIFIGEDWGGCTADDRFFRVLARDWVEVATHQPVQWSGMHDQITVYDRKSTS